MNTKYKTIKAIFIFEINDEEKLEGDGIQDLFEEECNLLAEKMYPEWEDLEMPVVDWYEPTIDLESFDLERTAMADDMSVYGFYNLLSGEIDVDTE